MQHGNLISSFYEQQSMNWWTWLCHGLVHFADAQINPQICLRTVFFEDMKQQTFPCEASAHGISQQQKTRKRITKSFFFFFSAVWAPCSYRFYCTYHPTRAKLRLCPWTSCAPFGCDLHGDLCVQWVISDMETVEERCHQHPGVQRVKKRSFWCMLTTECTRVGVFVVCFFSA